MSVEFDTLVDYMIALNKTQRAKIGPVDIMLGLAGYHMDFSTVHCNLGRRVGKTTYIVNRAGPKDLIILPTESMLRFYKDNTTSNIMTASAVARIPETFRGLRIPYLLNFYNIYVDEPALCSKYLTKSDLYRNLSRSQDQTFILLGE